MMNRTQDLHIYAHKDLETLMRPLLDYHCSSIPFQIIFHHIDPKKKAVIFEDRTLTVTTIPLRHSVPTCGFLFEEKPHRTPRKLFRFAYCSDTGYKPAIVPQIKGVDVLYHEATYLDELKDAAQRYQHSTAKQAAKIALKAEVGKLIIGHFSARVIDQELFLQEAKEVFPNVELAQDKTVYDFDK
jgi:ribonuclease Z